MSAVAEHKPRDLEMVPERTGNATRDMVLEAMRSGQSIEVIREIRALAKEIAADEAKQAFDEAVSDAKAEIEPIAKTKAGHNSKYADLGSISRQVDPILSKYGLSVRHRSLQEGTDITVICILSHKLGHFEETSLTAKADTSGSKNSIQAIGSTLTYLQRYTKVLAVGIAMSDDDDGEAAGDSREAMEKITEAQRDAIIKLIEEAKTTSANWCKVAKVGAIPDLPAKDYDRAVAGLRQRIATLKAKEQAGSDAKSHLDKQFGGGNA